MRRSSEQGIGLLPIALALLIVALAAAGVMMKYSEFQKNKEVSASIDDIQLIKDKIERLFSHKVDYSGLDDDFLIDHAELPAVMINTSEDTIRGRFNYYSQIGSYEVGPTSTGFRIRATFVSERACVSLATSQFSSEAESVRVWNDSGDEVFPSKPMLSDLQDICFNDRPQNHVEFRFRG